MLQETKGFEYVTITAGNRSWTFYRSAFYIISPTIYKQHINTFPGLTFSFEKQAINKESAINKENPSTQLKPETNESKLESPNINHQSLILNIIIPESFSKESVDTIINYIYHQALDIHDNIVSELYCLGKSLNFGDVISKTSSYIILKFPPRQIVETIRVCSLHQVDSEPFERLIDLKFNEFILSLDTLPLHKLYLIIQKNYHKVSSDKIAELITTVSNHQNKEELENDDSTTNEKVVVDPMTIIELFSLVTFVDFDTCDLSSLQNLFLSLSKIPIINNEHNASSQEGSINICKFVFNMIEKQISMKSAAKQMIQSLEKSSEGIKGAAEYQLSIEHERGLYIPKNLQQSEQYENAAIEKWDPEIILEIADKYFYVRNDRETAFSLYRRLLCPDNTSQKTIEICGYHIALKMDDFLGQQHDAIDAISLLKLAIEQGSEDCCVYGYELSLRKPNLIQQDYIMKHITEIFGNFIVNMGCEEIGDNQFSNNAKLESVFIPPSVKRIGENSFADCTNIKRVFITPNVEIIGSCAFVNCTSLTNIKLPSSIKKIGESAFNGCISLSTVEYAHDSKIESIEFACFGCCVNLETIQLPDNLKQICDEAFYQCHHLSSISIPNSVWNIGEKAFFECKLLSHLSFDVSSCLYCIQNGAFSGCSSLDSLYFPSSLKTIGDNAFEDCINLANLHFSFGIERIGNSAFYRAESLRKIDIPDSTNFIGDYAFYQCYSLTFLALPLRLKTCGQFAFYQCVQLEELSVANLEHLNLLMQNGNAKSLKKLTLLSGPIELNEGQIGSFDNLEEIAIPSVIRKIGQGAFKQCAKIKRVILESKFTEVDVNAFISNPEIIYTS